MKRILLLISFAVLTLGLTACPAETPAPGKIPAVATGNKDLSILVEALTKANLVTALDGDGPFTVFAPTDAAFAALLTELGITKEQLLARADLADILKYHVVSGSAKAASLTNGQELTTLQGGKITVAVAGGKVSLNSGRANVTTPDVAAANGVVHVIDKVLLPPAPAPGTIVDVASGNADFSTLVKALGDAGLVDTLKGAGPFTVFAPTNAAFAKLAAVPTGDALKRVLLYHVVPGKLEAKDVIASAPGTATTVQGSTFSYAVVAGKVVLTDGKGNTVNVTSTDIQASNGVIHVIDSVLLPPDPVSVDISLSGANEVPPLNNIGSSGSATIILDGNTLKVDASYSGFIATMAHIHGPIGADNKGPVVNGVMLDISVAGKVTGSLTLSAAQIAEFEAGKYYLNIHSKDNPGGEIRGNIPPKQ
jgi:transforming growth factor-beta-induced protein